MFHLLTSPRTARTVRGLIGTLVESAADAIRSLAPTEAPVVEAPDPTDIYTDDNMPAVEDIERAAFGFDLAADSARAADRAKRKYRKLLDRLPAGTYGQWLIRRVTTNRQTVDLDAVRRIFKENGLGDVPMRDAAPALRVERIDTVPADAELLAGVAA